MEISAVYTFKPQLGWGCICGPRIDAGLLTSVCRSCTCQGGTFERLQQRCSGDMPTCEQTKYVASLPGLPDKIICERLATMCLTDAELKLAKEPGMSGSIWGGRAMIFDEGYGILQLLGIMTDPKQATNHCIRLHGWSIGR